jgi:SAM-dependent methyltransferase
VTTKRSDLNCPVCGESALHAFDSKYARVAQCTSPQCEHLYAHGVSDDAGLQTHDVESDALEYAHRNRRLVAFFAAEGLLGPNSTVLDVGAGAGHVSDAIRRRFPDAAITCVEGDEASRTSLLARGYKCHASLDESAGTFDVVLLIEVIEHVPRPVEFLRLCANKLSPGGRVFLTTPCGQTARGSVRTNAYDTPEHVQFFTERSLQRACAEAGLYLEGFLTLTRMYPRRSGWRGAIDSVKHFLIGLREDWIERRHLITFMRVRNVR